jgi:starch synthase
VPIVRATGGLDDTVVDIRDNPERANGIKFVEYSGRALAKSMRKGLALYETPELLQRFRQNGMGVDFSWDRTSKQYLSIYKQAVA